MYTGIIEILSRFTILELIGLPILAIIPLAILFAIFGSISLWENNAVFGHTLSHSLLLPMTVLPILGIQSSWIILICNVSVAIVFAILSVKLPLATEYYSRDTMLLVIAFISLAISLVLSRSDYGVDVMSYITGDILLVNLIDIFVLYILALIVMLIIRYYWRVLIMKFCDPNIAHVMNPMIDIIAITLLLLQAVFIAVSIKIAGVIMASATIIMPAAIVRIFARSPLEMLISSIVIAILVMMSGMFMAIYFDMQVSPVIVMIYGMIWILLYVFKIAITRKNRLI